MRSESEGREEHELTARLLSSSSVVEKYIFDEIYLNIFKYIP